MFGFIPNFENENVSVFTASNLQFEDQISTSWQIWNKPSGISFVKMYTIGGGGGGEAGQVGASGTSRAGGGGGGAAAQSIVIYPAKFLPDALYIKVGRGGDGGLTNLDNGTSGLPTSINLDPNTTVSLCYAAGAPGDRTAAAVGTYVQMPWAAAFPSVFLAGAAGTGSTTGNPVTVLHTDFARTIGAQGRAIGSGNSPGIGGPIAAAGNLPAVAGGASGGGNGENGYWFWKPMIGAGGAGGGSSATSGGAGGNGAFGCGGGGGGAGSVGFDIGTLTSPGSGGNGGPGLAIITCW